MAQFFDFPLNHGGSRSQYREVADNDYATFTDKTSMLLNIDTAGNGMGDARAFTHIFLKSKGVASYAIALTDPEPGIGLTDRTLSVSVTNDSGDVVDTFIDGDQHDLYDLETIISQTQKLKAKAITLTFTAISGQTARIYEVMILDRLLTINSDGGLSQIDYDSMDLGTVEPDLRGRLSYVPPIGGERDKWLANLTLYSPRRGRRERLADELISFIRLYKNFVFAPEYNRYPDRVYPALWPNPQTQIRYLSKWKGGGRRVRFSVREA